MNDLKLEQAVLADINMDHTSLQQGVNHLIEWLTKQPHLPNIKDEAFLKAFIIGSKSIERSKLKLDKFFTVKTKIPTFYSKRNRDPRTFEWNQIQPIAFLPNLTPEGCKLIFVQMPLSKEARDNYNYLECNRLFFMLTEIMLKLRPFTSGLIIVLDFTGVKMEFVTKFFTSLTVTCFDIYQNILPVRTKAIICINASNAAEYFCDKFLKGFFSEKIGQRVFCYSDDHKVLSKHFPLELLPSDFGGKNPPLMQLFDDMKLLLEKERDWLMNEGCLGSNEVLRPKDNNADQLQGTFRKLQID